jgi:hypothetical protein
VAPDRSLPAKRKQRLDDEAEVPASGCRRPRDRLHPGAVSPRRDCVGDQRAASASTGRRVLGHGCDRPPNRTCFGVGTRLPDRWSPAPLSAACGADRAGEYDRASTTEQGSRAATTNRPLRLACRANEVCRRGGSDARRRWKAEPGGRCVSSDAHALVGLVHDRLTATIAATFSFQSSELTVGGRPFEIGVASHWCSSAAGPACPASWCRLVAPRKEPA